MNEPVHFSNQEARHFLLAKHGFWPPRALRGKEGVLTVFDRLACIQFDPLNIVARNADLVLQSRVGDYQPGMLYELAYGSRQLYDYWDKMMAYLRMRDWPKFALPRARWRQRHSRRLEDFGEYVDTILDAIRDRGPMCSLDFDERHDVGWKTDWRWGKMKAAKALLEMLGDTGDLMVSHRQGARRYYDLAERVVPEEIRAQTPLLDKDAYLRWRLSRRCQGIGLIGPAIGGSVWAGVGKAPERTKAINELLELGEMVPVRIEADKRTYYMLARDLSFLDGGAEYIEPKAAIVAPLDNLLWPRDFVERLFGFEYRWEVYKPVDERQYGYYVLPVLYGDRFVARFDAKLDRQNQVLRVLSWHWESGESATSEFLFALQDALAHLCVFLRVERILFSENVDAFGTPARSCGPLPPPFGELPAHLLRGTRAGSD
jgi:uncharacterized protein YcaQ